MSSCSEVDLEKLMYLQPNMIGGQAARRWTSFAPLWNRYSDVSRIWVPRTTESSRNRSFLSWISSWTGISFIRAMRFRWDCSTGMKERGQVGVYLMNGLEKGIPDAFAYPIACAVPESGMPATWSMSAGVRPSLFAMFAPQL